MTVPLALYGNEIRIISKNSGRKAMTSEMIFLRAVKDCIPARRIICAEYLHLIY